jgi:hypothetical protein
MKIMIIIIVNYFVWKSDFFTQKTMTNELLIRHTYYTIIDWHCIVLSLRKMLTSVSGALVKELHIVKSVLKLVYFTFSKYKEYYNQCKTYFF